MIECRKELWLSGGNIELEIQDMIDCVSKIGLQVQKGKQTSMSRAEVQRGVLDEKC
jgi:hypothetical protein